MRKRILLVAEAVTLAHVARPFVLARSLDNNRFEVHLACAKRYEFFLKDADLTYWPVQSIPGEQFLNALAKGAPLYDYSTLARYVEEELRLLEAVEPDIVVGDFRLSLSVSAPLSEIPYAAVANAHWSPYAVGRFPLPEHPMVRMIGAPIANAVYQIVQPVLLPAIFAYHARAMNRLRRRYGLTPLGDLRHVYTYGDYTLYPDVPGLVPTFELPPNHHYIGPVLWSPDVMPPPWWDKMPIDRPRVYVTLGSSGQVDVLPMVIEALAEMPVSFLLATAGRIALTSLPDNVWAWDYLPGTEAVQRSALVISNGGSATVYQTLAEGVPVLGIASNMDQYLTMGYVQRAGAGLLLRAGQATKRSVRQAIEKLLSHKKYQSAAKRVAEEFALYDAPSRFCTFVENYLSSNDRLRLL